MDIAGITEGLVPRPRHERTMIILEDEPLIALIIEEMADDLDWNACAVHSEAAAFRLLDQTAPELAVLDIRLGSGTSFAFAKACRERGIPMLFITGFTCAEIPAECGNAPILPKPFSPADFQLALRRCLGSSTKADGVHDGMDG